MQNYEGTLGAMSIWRRWLEEESLKLPGVAAWLCCVLLVGVSLTQTASAQTVTYIHTDALGSVVAETDANGSVIKRYDYEPYGAVVGGEVTDGPGYAGHVSDSVTGLSYMQQRYMDPQLGVFLSVDPVTAYQKPVEQFNRYRYANGNPYKFTDPDGRESGAAFKVVNDATNGQPVTPPPRNPNDKLGPAIGVALATILAAPVVAEVGLVALANPAAVATATEIGAGAAGVTGTAGVAGLAGREAGAARDFFSGTKYTDKVLGQMKQGDYHAFPESVKAFQGAGQVTGLKGGDGVAREMLSIPGGYKGRQGSFEFIKEANGAINHRLFKPEKEL